jgi:hypothetical protein
MTQPAARYRPQARVWRNHDPYVAVQPLSAVSAPSSFYGLIVCARDEPRRAFNLVKMRLNHAGLRTAINRSAINRAATARGAIATGTNHAARTNR